MGSSLPLPLSPVALSLTQVRHARTMTKAELEDLQGIPVRLLRDIIGFGKKRTCQSLPGPFPIPPVSSPRPRTVMILSPPRPGIPDRG